MNWWPFTRNPLVVEHVRYVSKPCIDPLDKALAMARQMHRDDLVGRIENVRAGR